MGDGSLEMRGARRPEGVPPSFDHTPWRTEVGAAVFEAFDQALSDLLNLAPFHSWEEVDQFMSIRARVAALGDSTCRSCRREAWARAMSWPVAGYNWSTEGGKSIHYICASCGEDYTLGGWNWPGPL